MSKAKDSTPEKITAGTMALRYGFPEGHRRIVGKRYGLNDLRTEGEWYEALKADYTFQRQFTTNVNQPIQENVS